MRQSLHDFMRVGIVHFMAYPSAKDKDAYLETIAEIAYDEFFGGIEITSAPDAETANDARNMLKSAGLAVGFGAQPILLGKKGNLNAFDVDERTKAVELVKHAVDEAYSLGAQKLGLLSGPTVEASMQDKAARLLIESLQEICSYANTKGDLAVTLELFDQATDKRCLVGSTRLAVEVAQEVRKTDGKFGLMVDLSHLPMQGESPAKALFTTRGYLTHAHMGNCVMRDVHDPLYGDTHPRFGYTGGEIDVPELTEYLRALLDIGYLAEGGTEVLAFEIKPAPGESSKAIIAQAKRTLRQAWQRV